MTALAFYTFSKNHSGKERAEKGNGRTGTFIID
jgi:hypothetical protein